MNFSTVYGRTSKGLQASAVKGKTQNSDASKVLANIDGITDSKTILAKMSNIPAVRFEKIINKLLEDEKIVLLNEFDESAFFSSATMQPIVVEEVISSEFFKHDMPNRSQQDDTTEQQNIEGLDKEELDRIAKARAETELNKEAGTIAKIQASIQETIKKHSKHSAEAQPTKQVFTSDDDVNKKLWDDESEKLSESLRYSSAVNPYQSYDESWHIDFSKWLRYSLAFIRSLFVNFVVGAVILTLLTLLLSNIEFLMRPFIKPVSDMAAATIGEPVHIKNLHTSLWPQPGLVLEGVSIGDAADLNAKSIIVTPDFSTLLQEKISLNFIQFNGMSIPQTELNRPLNWAKSSANADKLKLNHTVFKQSNIVFGGMQLPNFDADINTFNQGKIIDATLHYGENNVTVKVNGLENSYHFVANAKKLLLSIGAPLSLDNLKVEGTVDGHQLIFSKLESGLYNGNLDATFIVDWSNDYIANGEFQLSGVSLKQALPNFTSLAQGNGAVSAKASFESKGKDLATLFAQPEINAEFNVTNGEVQWIGIVAAMQGNTHNAAIGGITEFDKLMGKLTLENNIYHYQNLSLRNNNLNANANLRIAKNLDLSGNVNVLLNTHTRSISSDLRLSGKANSPMANTNTVSTD
jgi:hypothetical protein